MTLKFSEKKEEAKQKSNTSCGDAHPAQKLPRIRTPEDIHRVFIDVVDRQYVSQKSMLKMHHWANSICSESSAAGFNDCSGLW